MPKLGKYADTPFGLELLRALERDLESEGVASALCLDPQVLGHRVPGRLRSCHLQRPLQKAVDAQTLELSKRSAKSQRERERAGASETAIRQSELWIGGLLSWLHTHDHVGGHAIVARSRAKLNAYTTCGDPRVLNRRRQLKASCWQHWKHVKRPPQK